MPGPTPITAPFRLNFQYRIDTLDHRCQFYLRTSPSADSTGYDTVPRAGFAAVGVSAAVDGFFTTIAPLYKSTDTTFLGALLEELVSGAWVYRAYHATAVTPTGSAVYQKAMQLCESGRDTNNKPMPVYLYEQHVGDPSKDTAFGALGANYAALVEALFNPGGTAVSANPVAWRVSRGNVYSQRWLAQVTDSNEKLRRRRGIK